MGAEFRCGSESMGNWSYSSYDQFRQELAAELGIVLSNMEGFGGNEPWEPLREEPLVMLLNSSDSHSRWSPSKCAKMAPRLQKILDSWSATYLDGEVAWNYQQAQRLTHLMRVSVKINKPLLLR